MCRPRRVLAGPCSFCVRGTGQRRLSAGVLRVARSPHAPQPRGPRDRSAWCCSWKTGTVPVSRKAVKPATVPVSVVRRGGECRRGSRCWRSTQPGMGHRSRRAMATLHGLFAWAHVAPNLARYPRWLLETQTPLAAARARRPWAALGGAAWRRVALATTLSVGVIVATYFAYIVFDDWWYIRVSPAGAAAAADLHDPRPLCDRDEALTCARSPRRDDRLRLARQLVSGRRRAAARHGSADAGSRAFA